MILAASVIGCGGESPLGGYCLTQYDVEIRAEMRLDCPNGRAVIEDLDRVARVVGEPDEQRALFGGYLALYEKEDTLLNGRAGGYVELDAEVIHVATDGNERGVLRHEALHVAFFRLTEDPDYNHSDPRWAEVN